MKKLIFGKTFKFHPEKKFLNLLKESIELYPNSNDSPDLIVKITSQATNREYIAINPKIHKKSQKGMVTDFGCIEVYWVLDSDGILNIEMVVRKKIKFLASIRKLLSIEYSSEIEEFEQVLHELLLVPSTYFFKDIAPVHAACVSINGKASLLAGTGGVGKSSALLSLRESEITNFISDDIAIISSNKTVYSNMAWPKIYGYNCEGNNLMKEILENRGSVDKIQFYIKNKINSAAVRRKVSPDKLYKKRIINQAYLDSMYYLVREDVSSISVSALATNDAVDMTIAVMLSEYSIFHKFLNWEEYNSKATNTQAVITMGEVLKNWRYIYINVFSSVKIKKISIPIKMNNKEYQNQIFKIIINQDNIVT